MKGGETFNMKSYMKMEISIIRAEKRGRREWDMRGVKRVMIEGIKEKNDPESYLVWEIKVEHIFSYHHYNEERKVSVNSLGFSNYALIWWEQVLKEMERNRKYLIDAWEEMKSLMRRGFIPSWYHRKLHNKLQRLTHGNKNVNEYFKKMEVAMTCFLHGLNNEIRNIVELQNYEELGYLENQPKEDFPTHLKEGMVSKNSNNFSSTNDTSLTKSKNIKCFKCLEVDT
ncbi:hypothetical protein CR513_12931, partial [Mucuna pruriens]